MRAFIFKVMGLVLLIPALASSQAYQGGMRGAVRDADGGVLPGTTVTITNSQTGAIRTAVTNERGEYVFASVASGTYNLAVELSGFAPFRREGLEIGVATQLVQDVSMSVGGIAESVTVTGETPLIETATASVASAIDKAQLDVLPTPGRNVFIYAVTTPNVIHTGDPVFVRKQDQTNSSLLSLAGGPLRGNNYTVDGVSIVDMRNRAVVIPNNDAVEEMKVQVNTYDAEMGRTGGGVFNVLHKSGTNNFAGSALWQTRPQFGRGLLFFEETDHGGSGEAPESPYNLFSFAGGGPIIKDKTFFWGSYEQYINTDTRNASIGLPTAAQRAGNFAGGPTIYDPLTYNPATGTRSPFPGNVIPPGRIDPAARAMADLLAQVGEGPTSMTALLGNVAREPTFKIDHSFNEKWQIAGTYMYYKSEEPANPFYTNYTGSSTLLPFDTGAAVLFRDVNSLALNLTNVPSDDSVITVRYGYNKFGDSTRIPNYDIGSLGFNPQFVSDYEAAGNSGFPTVFVEGYGDNENLADGLFGSWGHDEVNWKSSEVSGVYSKFVGSHTFKGGLQYRRIGVDSIPNTYGAAFYFNPGFTQGPSATNPVAGSGDSFASFLLGLPNADSNFVNAAPANVFIKYYGGFVQDDWRVNENLVVNLGLRLEHEDGLAEEENRFIVGWAYDDPFPVQVPGLSLTGGLQYAGTGGKTTQSDPKGLKLGPRAGFVYSLNDRTVVRGGYGIFWAPNQYPGPGQNTFATRGYTAITNVVPSNDGDLTPSSATLSNPYPNGVEQPVGNSLGVLTGVGGTVRFNDQNARSPYVQQYSIDVQHDLGNGVAVKVGYLGSRGTDLWIGGTNDSEVNINQLDPSFLSLGTALNDPLPNPFYGNAVFGSLADSPTLPRGQLLRPYPQYRDVWARHVSEGASTYNALRVEFEKKFRQWGARVNYTLSSYKSNVYESNTRVSDEQSQIYNSTDLGKDNLPTAIIDSPQWFNINGLYRFPSPDGGAAQVVLGGWSASASTIIRSGFPLAVTQSSNALSSFGYPYQRPNLVGDPSVSGGAIDNYQGFTNPAAFANTDAYSLGNTPYSITDQRTPPLLNWDVSFDKSTKIGGGAELLLRFEFINFFSQANFNGQRSIYGQSNFGAITGVGGFPRTFQFMAKVIF